MSGSRSKNLCKYVIPTVLGCVSYFLFTIIDGIFVGRGIGTNAIGAVNIAFPFIMVVCAAFMLTTIGGVTVVAIRLGRGDTEGANSAFMHSLSATAAVSVVLCAVGTLFADRLCVLLGANETFYDYVYDYLFWYSVFIIPSGLSSALQGFCRNDGSPVLVSAAVIIGTVCNIFGDWLFIFPLGMGLKGAAIATGLSQTIVMLIVLSHFALRKGKLRFSSFRPDRALYKKIALRGAPEFISQLASPAAIIATNYVLLAKVGDIGVNAFAIIGYVASFSVAIFFGTAEGLQPIFGRCYGAKNESDLKYYFRAGLIINFVGSIVIYALLFFVGAPVCRLFGADSETLAYTVASMPKYAWGFSVMALNTIISAYLYSTKRSGQAIVMNVLRTFVFDLAIILILPELFPPDIIWYTFGIFELMVLIVAVYITKRSERNGVVFK